MKKLGCRRNRQGLKLIGALIAVLLLPACGGFVSSLYRAESNSSAQNRLVAHSLYEYPAFFSHDSISESATVGNNFYFTSSNYNDPNVYVYDGSQITKILGDFKSPMGLVAGGGNFYFVATDKSSGDQGIYKYDGTSLSLIMPNCGDWPLGTIGADLYLSAYISGSSVIRKFSSGTVTTVVSDLQYTPVMLPNLIVYLLLDGSGNQKIFGYDGSSSTQLGDINSGANDYLDGQSAIMAAGSDFYFFSYLGGTGTIPFRYHSGSITAVPLPPSPNFSTQKNIMALSNGAMYYTFQDSNTYSTHLYYFDGNSTTTKIADDLSRNTTKYVWGLDTNTNTLYFPARNGSGDLKLYKALNGTVTELADLNNSDATFYDYGAVVSGSDVYVSAWNGAGEEKVFYWNGTTLAQLSNTNSLGPDLSVWDTSIQPYGSDFIFKTRSPRGEFRLSKAHNGVLTALPHFNTLQTEGVFTLVQAAGDIILAFSDGLYWFNALRLTDSTYEDVVSAPLGSSPNTSFQYVGNRFYGVSSKVFALDGSTLTQVSNLNPSGSDQLYDHALAYDGAFFFVAAGTGDRALYRADGNVVTRVSHTGAGGADNVDFNTLFVWGDDLYFVAEDTSADTELYRVHNGVVSAVFNFSANGILYPGDLVKLASGVYFRGYNASYQKRAFWFNGTTVVAMPITNPGGEDAPDQFTTFKNQVCYRSKNSSDYLKLYCYNGTTATQISDTNTGDSDMTTYGMPNPVAVGDNLYFSSQLSGAGTNYKLFRYDGTSVSQVSDIRAGSDDGPSELIAYDSQAYFVALTGDGSSSKFYRVESDYTVTEVSDIPAGTNYQVLGEHLYFKAYDPVTGDPHIYRY